MDDGTMGRWDDGEQQHSCFRAVQNSNTPILQDSTTPLLHYSITPRLRTPSLRSNGAGDVQVRVDATEKQPLAASERIT
jgi:hypothetical protein